MALLENQLFFPYVNNEDPSKPVHLRRLPWVFALHLHYNWPILNVDFFSNIMRALVNLHISYLQKEMAVLSKSVWRELPFPFVNFSFSNL